MVVKPCVVTTQCIDEGQIGDVNSSEFSVIVLAAGLSNRMGQTNKLLLELNGQSLLQRCVVASKASGAGEIIVVLGHDRANTEREITVPGVRSVVNTQYATGQMSSVHCGLSAISDKSKATLICLSDQPLITAKHLQKLMWAFENRSKGKQIVIPMYQGTRGNPVVLGDAVRRQVLQEGGNPGCRGYIDKNPEQVDWVHFNDPAYVSDIDTPDEYATMRDTHSKN